MKIKPDKHNGEFVCSGDKCPASSPMEKSEDQVWCNAQWNSIDWMGVSVGNTCVPALRYQVLELQREICSAHSHDENKCIEYMKQRGWNCFSA